MSLLQYQEFLMLESFNLLLIIGIVKNLPILKQKIIKSSNQWQLTILNNYSNNSKQFKEYQHIIKVGYKHGSHPA